MYNRKLSDESGFDAPLTTDEGLEADRVTQSDFANATDIGASPVAATHPIEGDATEPAPPAETPPPSAPPETPPPSEPTPVEPVPQQPDAPPPMPNPPSPPQPDEIVPPDPV